MEKRLPRIKALLTPGEVAKRSGVAVSALHFYESKGLIKSIRNGGNQRRYTRDVLRYVAIIKIAQRIGIPLATIGEAFGVLPEECMYLGDSGTDMQTGKAAGMYTVGVLWGYREKEELLKNGADALVESPEDILDLYEEKCSK